MKKTILLMSVILLTIYAKAQVEPFICATDDNNVPNLVGVFSGSNDPSFLDSMEPVVLNVYYWRVDAPDGSIHPWALTENRALESIAHLNINFNPIGVYFKYRGMGNFSSPSNVMAKIWDYDIDACVDLGYVDADGYETLSRCQRSDLINYANNSGYVEANAINFYVPRGLTDFGGSSQGPLKSITHPGGLISSTIIHELGHNFSLPHTWQGWYQPNNSDLCEHVTRFPTDSNFNADIRGDGLVGTAAMPSFRREYCTLNGLPSSECSSTGPYYFYYYDIENCEYTGADEFNRSDCEGTIYQINPENARNTMSYAPGSCMDNFSIDQGIQMREYIDNSSSLQLATTEISSLYEPYKGEYYLAGALLPEHKTLFQPGFDYKFVECSGNFPQPSDFYESFSYNINNVLLTIDKEESDFRSIVHPNHSAIMILDHDLVPIPYPRKCYNNYNKASIGGSVTKFNDNVFNTNVTITTQDSTSINNQNLIQELPSGLYKIEKNYEDGAVQETVIYKGSN